MTFLRAIANGFIEGLCLYRDIGRAVYRELQRFVQKKQKHQQPTAQYDPKLFRRPR